MASVLITTEADEKRVKLRPDSKRPSLATVPLFRFGLRQLLLFVAVICVLLAAMASTKGIAALVLLLASTIVAMHVLATAIGNRLRSQTDEEQVGKSAESLAENSNALAAERSAKLAAIRSAPRSPWHAHGCTYLPWLPRFVLGAVVLGGVGGALLLSGMIGQRTSPAGIVVGASSFGVLAGWFSFLCGNFYGVFRQGFRQALAEQKKDQGRQAISH